MAVSGGQKVDVDVDVKLEGEMAEFFKAFVKYYVKETDRTGHDPVFGI